MLQTAQLDLQLMEHLNERERRLYGATRALHYGYGGMSRVHRELGLDFKTITQGIKDLTSPPMLDRVRKPGGGRKKRIAEYPDIPEKIQALVKPKGDPMKQLQWTHISIDKLTAIMREAGYAIGKTVVNHVLWELGFNLQTNKKQLHKKSHKDRDRQFRYIDRLANGFIVSGNPVISIDAKKTEKVGNFKNNGKVYREKGQAIQVEDHDFGKKDKNKRTIQAIPYGIYDIAENKGFVNVGTDHNTAEFAVESLRRWWNTEGRITYPAARHIMITADSGGANGNRVYQWKWELQQLVNEIGLTIHVLHFPAGTSKWNKIEHKLFSFISQNWQGVPLQTYEIILGLIGGTTTKTGLRVTAELDTGTYELHKRPTDAQIQSIKIKKHQFHPEWNYSIYPNL